MWYILVVANGINHVDSSGIEMLRRLVTRLREVGITLFISGAKQQVIEVIERTGLARKIGAENIFGSDAQALKALMANVNGDQIVPAH